MQFLYKIPGYILLLFGGFCLSWGGFIVRSFQEANVWQILFLRSFFFIVALILFLSLTYKNKTIKVIKDSGVPGILGGFVMSFSFVAFIIAMNNTTVANVVFIISTQTMFLAIFGFFYLLFFKEIINIITDIEILRFISYQHFLWIIIIPPVASFCYQLDGIFIGASQTKEIRNAMIVSVIGFIATSIYLTDYFENHGLWFSLMLFMILRALTLNFYFNKILRKF